MVRIQVWRSQVYLKPMSATGLTRTHAEEGRLTGCWTPAQGRESEGVGVHNGTRHTRLVELRGRGR